MTTANNGDSLTVTVLPRAWQIAVTQQGTPGPAGAGVARGGTTGQHLAKHSNADYDTEWTDSAAAGLNPPVAITGTDPATVPLSVQGAAGQTADVLDVKGSDGQSYVALQPSQVTGSKQEITVNTNQFGRQLSMGSNIFNQASSAFGFNLSGTGGVDLWFVNDTPARILFRTNFGIVAQVANGGQLAVGPSASFGGGAGPMLFLANDTSDPSSNPAGGGILFVSNGALKYRGSSGTVTTLGPA